MSICQLDEFYVHALCELALAQSGFLGQAEREDWRVFRLSIVSGTPHSLVLLIWEAMRTIVIQPLPMYVNRVELEALDRLGFESGSSFESL